ncbi:MAG: hypothetical protein U0Q21_04225 [Dermatophilaceae bacterium]
MSVRDTACNGSLAFVHIHVYYSDGTGDRTTKHYDDSVCDTLYKSFNGLHFDATKRIKGFAVLIGDSKNGEVEGNFVDNPYTQPRRRRRVRLTAE